MGGGPHKRLKHDFNQEPLLAFWFEIERQSFGWQVRKPASLAVHSRCQKARASSSGQAPLELSGFTQRLPVAVDPGCLPQGLPDAP
jgi:hypothetical protein